MRYEVRYSERNGFSPRKAHFLLPFFFFLFFLNGFGQDIRVDISSSEEPGPTSANPIPLNFDFEGPVDELKISDFTVSNGTLQNINRETPDFIFQDSEKILDFTINRRFGFGDVFRLDQILAEELGDAVISIDYNSNNELFYLTLTNGIYKQGNSVPVINGNQFDTPLDMVINRQNGNIIVADSEAGKVFIFDSDYNLIETIGNGSNADSENPRGATGLALDTAGNIYVADNFTGNTQGQDAVKIYSPDGNYLNRIRTYNGQQIEDPFRIAVDKLGNIYVSESGGEDRSPRVIIFDKDYNAIKSIQGGTQGNPGSLVVDNYGYLYVVDYMNDFNLTDLFNDPLEVLANYEKIRDTKYTLNVFDTNKDFAFVKEFDNEELNLPIDIALDNCGIININNLQLSGAGPSGNLFGFPTRVEATFDFTLKSFQRQDLFTAEIVPENQGLVEVILENVDLFQCGPQPEDEFSIEYKIEEEDTPPVFQNCPSEDIERENDPNECGAVVTFVTPTATDENGDVEIQRIDENTNLNSGDQFPVGTTTITFQADDGTNDPVTCSFNIIVEDTEDPTISCPTDNIIENVPFGETGKVITYENPVFNDNCENASLEQTAGFPSGAEFPVGSTTNTFVVNDGNGNTETCSFEVIINEEPEDTPPVFQNCPSEDIERENDPNECGAMATFVTPTATDENGDVEVQRIDENTNLDSGDQFPVGTTTITFQADDGTNDPVTCSFNVIVEDTEDPRISDCPQDITETFNPEEGYQVPDFTDQIEASDNCTSPENLVITQNPQAGEIISNSQTITLTVKDADENATSCDFQLTLQEEQEATFTCPDPEQRTVIEYDENCDFEIPDYRDRITNFQGFENDPILVQSSVRNGDILNISISISDGTEEVGECNFPVNLEDQTPPEVICPPKINVPYTDSKEYVVEDYFSDLQISDNCSTTFEYSQSPMPGTVIDEDTTIEFIIIDENENQTGCNFRIEFFRETELQILNCPGDQVIEVDANCSYRTPDIASLIETNIEGAEISQNITPGFQINGSILLTITAKFEDQTDICEVQLIAEDTIDPVISCPRDQIVSPDENGEFMLPNYLLQAEYDDNCFIAQTEQFPDVGTIIDSNTEVELRVTDDSGNQTSCFFNVDFADNPEKPFDCKGSISFNLDDSGTLTIEPEDLLNITGETSEVDKYEFSLSRETFGCEDVTGQIPVTVSYTGPVNGSCTVNVDINELIAPSIDCPQESIDVVYESGSEYRLPDFSSVFEINDNCTPSSELSFEQSPQPGTVYTQEIEVPVELRVTDNNGNETTCSFSINLTHGGETQPQPPVTQNDTYATAVNTTLNVASPGVLGNDSDPDSRGITAVLVQDVTNGILTLNANGSFTYIPNADFLGPDGFTYVANDGELNSEITSVTIIVSGSSQLRLNCPQSESVIKANENCEYIVPDFATRVEFSPLNATIEQSIPPGTLVEEEMDITITASFEGETESCTFQLLLRDNTPPVISCPGDRTVFISEGGTYVVPDFRSEIERSDNCGLGPVVQEPEPNTVIDSDTQVNFVIFDAVSNASTCSFNLNLEVDPPGNQAPIATLDTYSTFINTTLNISAADGVLSNDIDSDSDALTAILVDDVNNGSLTLNADGSFVYEPDNDFTGTDQFSYFANDGEFNSEETFVSIEILEALILNIQCKESFVLELDEKGEAILNAEDLYTGDDTGVSFSLSRDNFNCDDIGQNEVILTYSGGASGSCNIMINVVDLIPPNLETQDISINLDESGMASISAEDVVIGSSDNCDPELIFELSRSSFSCKDVGTNEVQVTAEDSSGNRITETVIVTVTDENEVCDGSLEGSEYIFIYPNPNTGSFKVATPSDVTIQRMEVFDHRGRFIAAKDYDANAVEYAIDLGPLQEAVYVVKLFTNEGTEVRRFIFKY